MEKDINQEFMMMKLKIETLEEKINPDQGFVSRVNRNTQFREDIGPLVKDMYEIRRWKSQVSRVLWIIATGVILGLVGLLFMLK